ncbi:MULTISPECIES: hypothetical protein [unclassified Nocardioides]|jgi:hypothetical protein|uniref:hypothetical protein n=1 Tax=unclassified Nocardioides TaxID=2615069 RepID=UPI00114F81B5|nr:MULTISPECIES: hypothetical protein [unclassified Nocardioides]TQK69309.1 hypothetical protein FBY23_1071 [Nocardioides sp. SLBN-35]WGY01389.1 hypothetical protein QI633_22990 [Nocardioides sp. QY071]
MAESAEQVHARVMAAADEHGRVPLPDVAAWDVFPWEVVDGVLAPKPLAPPGAEGERAGAGGVDCRICDAGSDGVIWTNDRWRLKHLPERSGLPLVLMLEPWAHLDLPDLDDAMAGELGVLATRIARIVEGLEHIARCHVQRVGDGAEHLHVWLLARTAGLPAVRGSFVVDWDDILPPGPEDVWRVDLAAVAQQLAAYDGRAVALDD